MDPVNIIIYSSVRGSTWTLCIGGVLICIKTVALTTKLAASLSCNMYPMANIVICIILCISYSRAYTSKIQGPNRGRVQVTVNHGLGCIYKHAVKGGCECNILYIIQLREFWVATRARLLQWLVNNCSRRTVVRVAI